MLAAIRMLPHVISRLVHHGFDVDDEQGRLNIQAVRIWKLMKHIPGLASALLVGASIPALFTLWLLLLLDMRSCLAFLKIFERLEPPKRRVMSVWATQQTWVTTAGLPIERVR